MIPIIVLHPFLNAISQAIISAEIAPIRRKIVPITVRLRGGVYSSSI
jgi:hypothetical protein